MHMLKYCFISTYEDYLSMLVERISIINEYRQFGSLTIIYNLFFLKEDKQIDKIR